MMEPHTFLDLCDDIGYEADTKTVDGAHRLMYFRAITAAYNRPRAEPPAGISEDGFEVGREIRESERLK